MSLWDHLVLMVLLRLIMLAAHGLNEDVLGGKRRVEDGDGGV